MILRWRSFSRWDHEHFNSLCHCFFTISRFSKDWRWGCNACEYKHNESSTQCLRAMLSCAVKCNDTHGTCCELKCLIRLKRYSKMFCSTLISSHKNELERCQLLEHALCSYHSIKANNFSCSHVHLSHERDYRELLSFNASVEFMQISSERWPGVLASKKKRRETLYSVTWFSF